MSSPKLFALGSPGGAAGGWELSCRAHTHGRKDRLALCVPCLSFVSPPVSIFSAAPSSSFCSVSSRLRPLPHG